jgi:hypothetical protein
MYDPKTLKLLHEERLKKYMRPVIEDEPKSPAQFMPDFGAALKSLFERLNRRTSSDVAPRSEKRQALAGR